MAASHPHAYISAIAAFLPPDIISNQDLEKIVDTSDEWIRTRTGIHTRYILKGEGKATSDMAAPVLTELCKKRNISPEEIECVIVATTTPDFFFPSTATLTADKAGATNAWAFDLSAACSGFVYALHTGSMFIETGRYKKVAIIGADKMSSIIDYEDRNSCILFGDAAGGVLLEPCPQEGFGILDAILYADGSGKDLLYMKGGGSFMPATAKSVAEKQHFLHQKGNVVFKQAITHITDVIIEILEKNHLKTEDIAFFVPHQANYRILKAVAANLNIDEQRMCINIDRYGNTTAATVPLCLYEWQHQFKRGDNLLLNCFGAGFTWGAAWIKWY